MGRRAVVALNRATEVLRRERELPWFVLAVRLGYTPEYFRRAILPVILELSECIKREGKYVRWVCEDGSEEQAKQARREAEELFEKLEKAARG